MIELVFVVCLATAPDDCQRRTIPIYEPVSPMTCMMGAPATLAQWRETHPNWRVSRWRCEVPRATQAAESG
ncbi:MAG: hypothetical protein AAF416_19175 [Pseudomonadota bacterium]